MGGRIAEACVIGVTMSVVLDKWTQVIARRLSSGPAGAQASRPSRCASLDPFRAFRESIFAATGRRTASSSELWVHTRRVERYLEDVYR